MPSFFSAMLVIRRAPEPFHVDFQGLVLVQALGLHGLELYQIVRTGEEQLTESHIHEY